MISQKNKMAPKLGPSRDQVGSLLEKLRPNPEWAKLPLFDRIGWKRLPFGAFAESVNERVEPSEAADDIYIGLDDLDSENLHISRWGKGSDVVGTKLRFRKGDLIFGRRRAYQRKLAVAEMDGICSAHAMVVRAKKDVLPEFLPFLMMSDKFMIKAVEISVGSLSPTINWKTLREIEFDIPPLDQQRRIASILGLNDEMGRMWERNATNCVRMVDAFVEEVCLERRFPQIRLEEVLSEIIAGKSVIGIGEPAAESETGVLKVSAIGPRGFNPGENKRLINAKDFMPRFAVKANDFLITRCNTKELVGRVCIVDDDYPNLMLCDKTIKLVFDTERLDPRWAEMMLRSRSLRTQIESRATGTGGAMKNISQDDIRSLVIPLPSIEEQEKRLQVIRKVDSIKHLFQRQFDILTSINKRILNNLFF